MRAEGHIRRTGRAMAVALVLGAALGGCTSTIDHIPTALGGLPEGVPERPKTPATYPNVHEVPAPRSDAALSEAERKRLEADLAKTRDQYVPAGGAAAKP